MLFFKFGRIDAKYEVSFFFLARGSSRTFTTAIVDVTICVVGEANETIGLLFAKNCPELICCKLLLLSSIEVFDVVDEDGEASFSAAAEGGGGGGDFKEGVVAVCVFVLLLVRITGNPVAGVEAEGVVVAPVARFCCCR